ncbi:MAG: TetR/AcrR family transcriptional regulator [Crocinitomix sp.]|nr:TetR/AcrR family transcriptional regulator [Crocinitomix sp.]
MVGYFIFQTKNCLSMIEMTSRQFEIIESAGKILTHSGLSGLTTKKLANEMGFSEAALYRHFKGKEDILVAMLSYLAQDMETRFRAIDSQLSGVALLRAIFDTQLDFFKAHPHFVVVVFADSLMEESDRINQHIHKIMQVKRKHLLPSIIQAQETGFCTTVIDAEEIVHIIMGSFRLRMYKWRLSNFQGDLRKIGNQQIETLLQILKTA